VRLACRMILASMALGLASLVPGVRAPLDGVPEAAPIVTLLLLALFTGLTLWLLWSLALRRNWARWAMLAFLGLGWWLSSEDLMGEFLRSPLAATLDASCIALEMIACVLLFSAAADRWFIAQKVAGPS
jgi:hypothetical protein